MKPGKTLLLSACVVLAALVPVRSAVLAAVPTARDSDNYDRLLAIIHTGSEENKKTAKDALKAMGEVGIVLLKTDCKDIESPRGTLAWSLLKELVTDQEVLREFARKNLIDSAKSWKGTYGAAKTAKSSRQQTLQQIVGDYVDLLIASGNPRDFDLLLKALAYSLIVSDQKLDYGKDFETWQKIWTLLGEKVKASDSAQQLEEWQKTIDGHFRTQSLLRNYVDRKTIQAYHTASLVLMQRLNELKK